MSMQIVLAEMAWLLGKGRSPRDVTAEDYRRAIAILDGIEESGMGDATTKRVAELRRDWLWVPSRLEVSRIRESVEQQFLFVRRVEAMDSPVFGFRFAFANPLVPRRGGIGCENDRFDLNQSLDGSLPGLFILPRQTAIQLKLEVERLTPYHGMNGSTVPEYYRLPPGFTAREVAAILQPTIITGKNGRH
jgi:hypothetical protein